MKRLVVAVCLVAALVAAVALWQPDASANCRVEGDKLAVYLGGPVSPAQTLAAYAGQRSAVLADLLAAEPTRVLKAAVVFDRFVDPEEADASVSAWGLKPVEIHVALPDSEYSGGAVVTSSVAEAYQTHVADLVRMADEMAVRDPENKDIQADAAMAQEGKLAIYALVAQGTVERLCLAGEGEGVLMVDPFYDRQAERLAASRRLTLVWRVVPVRPDGKP